MLFLHMLANRDAYDAFGDSTPRDTADSPFEEPVETPRARVKIKIQANDGDECFGVKSSAKPKSALRPKSVHGSQSTRCVSPTGRPKSGKSLNFQLTTGRATPAVSIREVRTATGRRTGRPPLSASTLRSRDGVTSAKLRPVSSTRNGARSPTPNALKEMDPAFLQMDLGFPGFTAWRIQGSHLQPVDYSDYGFFHEGNAYLLLHISTGHVRSLHYWTGSYCPEADSRTVENKAHELDRMISNAHVFSREVQQFESSVFLRLFPDGIIYVEGKHKTNIAMAATYDKRMYLMTGRKYARASCAVPDKDLLRGENTVILDGYPRMYVWIGQKCGYLQRTKAMRVARRIQQMQRKGKCHVVVIDENDLHLNDAFKRKFEDQTFVNLLTNRPTANGTTNGSTNNNSMCNGGDQTHDDQLVLHRVSGDQVLYDMPEADTRPLRHCYLVKQDNYLLNRGPDNTIYMWVGSHSTEDDINRSLVRAKSFSTHHQYPSSVSVCRIKEDYEPAEFKKCFCDWRDRLSKEMSLTKCYTVGNISRALFSTTDRRTIATVKECWSEDTVGNFIGTTQIWVLNEDGLESWDHKGLFTNDRCYIILYNITDLEHPQHVLYYWIGCKSTEADRTKLVQLLLEKDRELEHAAVLIRVLDGKEPQHFMTALQNWMLIYDRDENVRDQKAVQMFCIREYQEKSVRIQQMAPAWSNLNSSSSYVILTPSTSYLWYGKCSGSTERESTKDLLSILCSSKMFSYEIVTEGKEPAALCRVLGDRDNYPSKFTHQVLERRPPNLVHCSSPNTCQDIEDFEQEDLSEEDVLILDLFDQMFVWCGEMVGADRRERILDIAKGYLSLDPAGRNHADVAIWVISQRNEPMAFIKHFRKWNALGYSGRHSYEVLRKRIRQDNAKIDLDESTIDTGFLGQPKYSYKTLIKRELPNDVDDTNKHYHLTEKQFQQHLMLSRLEFYHVPLWKQHQILKSARLLYSRALPRHSLDLLSD